MQAKREQNVPNVLTEETIHSLFTIIGNNEMVVITQSWKFLPRKSNENKKTVEQTAGAHDITLFAYRLGLDLKIKDSDGHMSSIIIPAGNGKTCVVESGN